MSVNVIWDNLHPLYVDELDNLYPLYVDKCDKWDILCRAEIHPSCVYVNKGRACADQEWTDKNKGTRLDGHCPFHCQPRQTPAAKFLLVYISVTTFWGLFLFSFVMPLNFKEH